MKKLITVTTALLALFVGTAAVSAQPNGKLKRKRTIKTASYKSSTNGRFTRNGFNNNGRFTRNGFNNNGRFTRNGFYNNGRFTRNGFYNGHYNRRGVYIYRTTKIVFKRRGKFKNTFLHKIFPNGRHKVRLIKSVKMYHVYPVKVRYKTKIKYLGGHPYRVTYKITRFSNGRVTRVVHKRKPLWKTKWLYG